MASAAERKLILVVEDESLIAMDITIVLEQHGWRVLGPSATIADALTILDGTTPDAAVLDVNLRGELITPVARRLREAQVPFVLVSAYSSVILAEPLLRDAPNLGKPFSQRRLVDALTGAVSRARS